MLAVDVVDSGLKIGLPNRHNWTDVTDLPNRSQQFSQASEGD
jgi:hypothetical protein